MFESKIGNVFRMAADQILYAEVEKSVVNIVMCLYSNKGKTRVPKKVIATFSPRDNTRKK